jgi:hypothetical protein
MSLRETFTTHFNKTKPAEAALSSEQRRMIESLTKVRDALRGRVAKARASRTSVRTTSRRLAKQLIGIKGDLTVIGSSLATISRRLDRLEAARGLESGRRKVDEEEDEEEEAGVGEEKETADTEET